MDADATTLEPYAFERRQMVADQIERRGLKNPRLLQVFRAVPRHEFVPEEFRYRAYDDGPLPIGYGQTISQPYIVALMTSLLDLQGDEKVLEIGTGSGYQAAILARMALQVYTVERLPELAEKAKALLERSGYHNVTVLCADGSLGWTDAAPYKAIMVTAAAAGLPQPLADQLEIGGKLVLPVGDYYGQMLQLWTREPGGMAHENILPVSFVPLRGKHGWRREDWSGFCEEG